VKPIITFLSDFGLSDEWVGVCKAVMIKISPEARILDISHQIPSFDVKKGALVLASALPFMPRSVHLAVVDPGVGTERRGIVIEARRGDFLVGPDNGLLIPAAIKLAGIKNIVEITNEKYFSTPISPTFQARDIFAPVAAYLANGVSMKEFGPAIKRDSLVKAPWGKPKVLKDRIEAEVIDLEKFGTIRFNCTRKELNKLGIDYGDRVKVRWADKELTLPFVKTFGEVAVGEALLLIDSSDFLCLAINQGEAASQFGLKVGERVALLLSPAY